MKVVIIIILAVICCCSSVISTIVPLTTQAYINSGVWTCVDIGKGLHVVGRTNVNEAECMYDPNNVGCFVIKQKKQKNGEVDTDDLKKQCANLINNYPAVVVDGTKYNLDVYTCGKGSKNEELWQTTGYENPDDTCWKILDSRSVTKEMKKLFY
jgi:hypothetical protein